MGKGRKGDRRREDAFILHQNEEEEDIVGRENTK